MKPSYFLAIAFASTLSVSLVACNKPPENSESFAAERQKIPPAKVSVVPVRFQTIPQYQTFAGRVTAFETTTVMPQITGIVEEVLFREGTPVQKGQPLYRINPDNYVTGVASGESLIKQAQAGLATAQAAQARAQAMYTSSLAALEQANSDVARYQQLIGINAVSEQTYQQAITQQKTARANLASAKATIAQQNANIATAQANIDSAKANFDSSQLNLGRTIVRAPISGVTTRSMVKQGALVSAGQSPMVTVSKLNPVFVDISQSSSEILKLRKQVAEGMAQQGVNHVELILEDGSTYGDKGQLQFREAQVDANTGTVTMRAVFNNQAGLLLPGMYVTTRVAQTVINNAMLLPQSAIMRSAKGETQVYIVDAEQKVQVRPVILSGTYDGNWIVTSGLQAGESVVVIGGSKVKPEQQVAPEPYVQPMAKTSSTMPYGNTMPASTANNLENRPKQGESVIKPVQADKQKVRQNLLNSEVSKPAAAISKSKKLQPKSSASSESNKYSAVETNNEGAQPELDVQDLVMLSKPEQDGAMIIDKQEVETISTPNGDDPTKEKNSKNTKDVMTELEKLEAEMMSSADNINNGNSESQ